MGSLFNGLARQAHSSRGHMTGLFSVRSQKDWLTVQHIRRNGSLFNRSAGVAHFSTSAGMVHFQQTGLAHTTFFQEWLAFQLISRNDSIFNTTAGMAHF
jgi:hypothetical protein